ncbi:hypothetical protein DL96DRAFT_1505325 [Flagelloscypha sp. PMI_526]|nr:hypothetical protein DL96DRAFT_1505325 [Flagelloscypha sp. PMI_526]
MPRPLFVATLATFLILQVLAQFSNVSVDDFDTSATGFQYSLGWKTSTSCPGCQVNADTSQSYGGTWHVTSNDPKSTGDSAFASTAKLTFNGTAVYVYFILPQTSTFPIGDISCSFYIDGENAVDFTRTAPGRAGYLFHQLVFSKSLSEGQHTLSIVNDAHNGVGSVMILDQVIYMKRQNVEATGTSQPSNNSGLSTGAKAGIGIGAAGLVLLMAILLILIRKKIPTRKGSSTSLIGNQGDGRREPSQTMVQMDPPVMSPPPPAWSEQPRYPVVQEDTTYSHK